jgi:hypothetical protein
MSVITLGAGLALPVSTASFAAVLSMQAVSRPSGAMRTVRCAAGAGPCPRSPQGHFLLAPSLPINYVGTGYESSGGYEEPEAPPFIASGVLPLAGPHDPNVLD